jgi:hypothetical protein
MERGWGGPEGYQSSREFTDKFPIFPDYRDYKNPGITHAKVYAFEAPLESIQVESRRDKGGGQMVIFDAGLEGKNSPHAHPGRMMWRPKFRQRGGTRKLHRHSKTSESETRKVKRSRARKNITPKSDSSSKNKSRKRRNSTS